MAKETKKEQSKVKKVMSEIGNKKTIVPATMKKCLEYNFGKTLCDIFFFDFNNSYP